MPVWISSVHKVVYDQLHDLSAALEVTARSIGRLVVLPEERDILVASPNVVPQVALGLLDVVV